MSVHAELLGHRFRFATSPGLFSADRVDDGTRLLLRNLPERAPFHVLDLGCGYGALGLPVAALHPHARCLLVDREMLAVDFARQNAQGHGLGQVEVSPSLGYRDVGGVPFDWILCNIPARAGEAALEYFFLEGARRLTTTGELRAVVIRDLKPAVERIQERAGQRLRVCEEGARHIVYAMGALSSGEQTNHEAPYARDSTTLGGLHLERPTDLAEEPSHLTVGMPLLLELLPKNPKGSAFVWRGGYGAAALCLSRRGATSVLAADSDLLATAFSQRNASRLQVGLESRVASALGEVVRSGEQFDLITGELRASRDAAEMNAADLEASTRTVRPKGQVLWLGLTRIGKPLLKTRATAIASRGPYTVWRLCS